MPDAKTDKPVETKAEKFKRLANKRVNDALNSIAKIRGITNKGNYEYTPEQAGKIMEALEGEMTKLGNAFKSGEAPVEGGFAL